MQYVCETKPGTKFNRLTFIGLAHRNPKNRQWFWKCVCECGNEVISMGHNIRAGKTNSCGCLQKERASAAVKKHGMSQGRDTTGLYLIWKNMRQRCLNPKNKRYADYGGRGIKMCDRWVESFQNFVDDMSPRPSMNHSIDRTDNDGNYCKENCQWAIDITQSRNRRVSVRVAFHGNKHIKGLCEEIGADYYRAYDLIIRRNIPVNIAVGMMKGSKVTPD